MTTKKILALEVSILTLPNGNEIVEAQLMDGTRNTATIMQENHRFYTVTFSPTNEMFPTKRIKYGRLAAREYAVAGVLL